MQHRQYHNAHTATPTPTHVPSPTPTHTPSANRIQGDVNCDHRVNEADFDFLLKYAAGLNGGTTPGGCPNLGSSIASHPWGDLNCDNKINAEDALWDLASTAGVTLPQPSGCVAIGHPLT